MDGETVAHGLAATTVICCTQDRDPKTGMTSEPPLLTEDAQSPDV